MVQLVKCKEYRRVSTVYIPYVRNLLCTRDRTWDDAC